MDQKTAFGDAELTTYMKVTKADGRVFYYRVVGGENEQIDEATYKAEGGQ